eukprot:GHUV01034422.1.p2 GENE.GHUV01034422.1~~GHUV01034422.1.p2  ORF type:complete len:106 (+),score=23.94 GHUV01034422.1:551-868(+)
MSYETEAHSGCSIGWRRTAALKHGRHIMHGSIDWLRLHMLIVVCRHSPTLVDALWALPVVQLAAGDAHSAALTSSGQMFVWGSNHFGQLGLVRDGDPLSMRVHRK